MKLLTISLAAAAASVALALAAPAALAQRQPSELDRAYEEARAAYLALQQAEERRDEGRALMEGDVQGTASGGTRPTEQYLGRQFLLEQEAEMARRRYDAAVRRWNDLK